MRDVMSRSELRLDVGRPGVSLDGDDLATPELDLLCAVLQNRRLAERLARAPGGWRDLSERELDRLRLTKAQKSAIAALQKLVSRSYPELPRHKFVCSSDVARVYARRLGGMIHEVVIGIALDGRNGFIAEVELSKGGRHSAALSAADALRPLLRAGASSIILVHNHPGGDPKPSPEDIELTAAIRKAAEVVRMNLVDHVIIGGRGGRVASMCSLGMIP